MLTPFRPLDQTQGGAVQVITKAKKLEFFRVSQAVKIKMHDLATTQIIGLDQRIGRAFHRAFVSEGMHQATNQYGFAGPQLAAES